MVSLKVGQIGENTATKGQYFWLVLTEFGFAKMFPFKLATQLMWLANLCYGYLHHFPVLTKKAIADY